MDYQNFNQNFCCFPEDWFEENDCQRNWHKQSNNTCFQHDNYREQKNGYYNNFNQQEYYDYNENYDRNFGQKNYNCQNHGRKHDMNWQGQNKKPEFEGRRNKCCFCNLFRFRCW